MCFDTRNTNYKLELNVLIQLPPMHAKNNHLNLSKRSCMILSIYTASMEDAEKFSIQTSQCADLLCTHKSCIYSVCTTKNTNIARCLLYMCIDRPAGRPLHHIKPPLTELHARAMSFVCRTPKIHRSDPN